MWPPDHFADGLLDEITPSQAEGIGLGQILLYREIFLRRTFVGPDVVSDARMLVSKSVVNSIALWRRSKYVWRDCGAVRGNLRHGPVMGIQH